MVRNNVLPKIQIRMQASSQEKDPRKIQILSYGMQRSNKVQWEKKNHEKRSLSNPKVSGITMFLETHKPFRLLHSFSNKRKKKTHFARMQLESVAPTLVHPAAVPQPRLPKLQVRSKPAS